MDGGISCSDGSESVWISFDEIRDYWLNYLGDTCENVHSDYLSCNHQYHKRNDRNKCYAQEFWNYYEGAGQSLAYGWLHFDTTVLNVLFRFCSFNRWWRMSSDDFKTGFGYHFGDLNSGLVY